MSNKFNLTPLLFFVLQDDLYMCSSKPPFSSRKPLDGGYQDLDYQYLYKIPWPQLVGASSSPQQHPHNKTNLNNLSNKGQNNVSRTNSSNGTSQNRL